jgi:hypothetical protein
MSKLTADDAEDLTLFYPRFCHFSNWVGDWRPGCKKFYENFIGRHGPRSNSYENLWAPWIVKKFIDLNSGWQPFERANIFNSSAHCKSLYKKMPKSDQKDRKTQHLCHYCHTIYYKTNSYNSHIKKQHSNEQDYKTALIKHQAMSTIERKPRNKLYMRKARCLMN